MSIEELDGWHFEVVCVRARKVKSYGDSYVAVATITIVDGEPHIEGLLGTEEFTHEDKMTIAKYLISQGHTHVTTSKFVNGDRRVSGFELSI